MLRTETVSAGFFYADFWESAKLRQAETIASDISAELPAWYKPGP
jgi:hypothetical protein